MRLARFALWKSDKDACSLCSNNNPDMAQYWKLVQWLYSSNAIVLKSKAPLGTITRSVYGSLTDNQEQVLDRVILHGYED